MLLVELVIIGEFVAVIFALVCLFMLLRYFWRQHQLALRQRQKVIELRQFQASHKGLSATNKTTKNRVES